MSCRLPKCQRQLTAYVVNSGRKTDNNNKDLVCDLFEVKEQPLSTIDSTHLLDDSEIIKLNSHEMQSSGKFVSFVKCKKIVLVPPRSKIIPQKI